MFVIQKVKTFYHCVIWCSRLISSSSNLEVTGNKGTILETETDIAVSNLPQAVKDQVKTHYIGSKIAEAASIVKANGKTIYEAKANRKDVLFDKEENFVKDAKD